MAACLLRKDGDASNVCRLGKVVVKFRRGVIPTGGGGGMGGGGGWGGGEGGLGGGGAGAKKKVRPMKGPLCKPQHLSHPDRTPQGR